ncbi:uncharacterized protein LOC143782527 [Ranitomeya variabilis]|uniref:uncharacterized protein LOC143782527 n=1 Tax=Ranitomeya variabilis TaxID=490064 RepID=UPI004055ACC4
MTIHATTQELHARICQQLLYKYNTWASAVKARSLCDDQRVNIGVTLDPLEQSSSHQVCTCERKLDMFDIAVKPEGIITETRIGVNGCPCGIDLSSIRCQEWRGNTQTVIHLPPFVCY